MPPLTGQVQTGDIIVGGFTKVRLDIMGLGAVVAVGVCVAKFDE